MDDGALLGYVIVGPAWIGTTDCPLELTCYDAPVNLIESRSRSTPFETRWMNAYQQTM